MNYKILVVVEGRSELIALQNIIKKCNISVPIQVDYLDLQPKATHNFNAKKAEKKLRLALNENFKKIVFLLDLEDRNCALDEVKGLYDAFANIPYMKDLRNEHVFGLRVVIKVNKFENWLIADSNSLSKIKGFTVTNSIISKSKNADNERKAEDILKQIIGTYQKGKHDILISQNIDPLIVAQHSRSFRRFLRVLEHPNYRQQSKNP